MSIAVQELNRSYVLHGCGGITIVQTRLAEYGRCHFTIWNSCPPDWRFRFVTYLSSDDLRQILADVMKRYVIRLYQEATVYAGNA